jgi:hydrogenase maturation protease
VERVLVIGYGNPGRRDDGLGPALARAVEALEIAGVTVDSDYQLQPEAAADVAAHQVVIFADADASGDGPFRFEEVSPRPELGFSSHSVSPAGVLSLARELFGATARGYLLGIRGKDFEGYGEGLGEEASRNLEEAVRFIEPVLRERRFPG